MVKSVLGVNHQGLTDWLIQRVSAVIMMLYSVGLFAYLIMHPGLDYAEWHALFSSKCMKLATLLFILSLLFHSWIGMWTVFTDYIKSFLLRLVLQVFLLLSLIVFFFAALWILWGV
ncbi:MAG: sdhD [Gammaproteobacteria bacterium]|jgi:succinate dehydrogenase / fumarate reductase membrane anchor subunit|nr:sdhD [Gammaproteobacteria bacterium]